MYQYGGLYIHCIAFKYDIFTGNDIWVNFRWRYVSGMTKNYDFNIFVPLSYNDSKNYIIDEKIYTDSNAKHDGGDWDMEPLFSRQKNNMNNAALRGEGDSNGAVNITSYYNSGSLSSYHDYSVHIVNSTFTYYMDGNLLGSISGTNLKMFDIGYMFQYNSRSTMNFYSAIQNITLTDKMSNLVPKPPYTLDEKDNEVYGISTE